MSNQLKHIEEYEQGLLNSEDRQEFEFRLAQDSELVEALSNYRSVQNALNLSIENDLRNQLNSWASSAQESKSQNIKSLWPRRLAVAASILLLSAVGYWTFNTTNSSQNLSAENTFEAFEFTTSRGGDAQTPWDIGFDLIEKKDQVGALNYFQESSSKDPQDLTLHFILGDLYFQSRQYQLAKNELKYVVDGQSLIWLEKAQLNYLLLSLETEWTAEAETILRDIESDSNHAFYHQALKIRSQLSN